MKGARLHGKETIRYEDVPEPVCQERDVVIEVKWAGLCGSDVKCYINGGAARGMELPRVLGHEVVGVIAECGSGVEGFRLGEPVVAAAIVPCGTCYYCQRGLHNLCGSKQTLGYSYDGVFAERMRVPAASVQLGGLLKVPNGLPLEHAVLAEPLSCVLNGQRLSHVGIGDAVVIFGGGPIGLLHAQLAKRTGAGPIILCEVSSSRLAAASCLPCVDMAIDAARPDLVETILSATDGRGADVVITAAPAPEAQVSALLVAAPRARVNFFGGLPSSRRVVPLDSNLIHYRELMVHGSADSSFSELADALKLLVRGEVVADMIVTDRCSLADIETAITRSRQADGLKAILCP